MNRFFLLLFCLYVAELSAQNPFQYKDYWKNRSPHPGYWQQDVHYTIDAIINDSLDEITGTEELVYYNNSPHNLDRVYFHLYQNAFQPGSYAHALNEVNKEASTFGKYESRKMGTLIDAFSIEGKPVAFSIDNTILMAKLPKPLKPGESVKFNISFRTYWDHGSMRRRFKSFKPDNVNKHYDGVHWYPRICVYDRVFGWETDQHLGKEFYGDYGVFDVRLTFPSDYIVEATGVLVNEQQVMPDELRKKIDISNYSKTEEVTAKDNKNRTIKRVPTGYRYKIPRDGTKTWVYHAENVHDFAFTADPTYRIGEEVWEGIRCISLAQEVNAAYWYPTASFVASVVKIYSEDFGRYGYPKIVAADARDGMEYPMITLNGGNWPGHQYVIAHEVGHNWFFGMIGNNETYRAMLDEGFTQFLTSWSIKRFNKMPLKASAYDERSVYNGYLFDAQNRSDATLNTHSDDFGSATGHGGGYRHVYYKTATMLYNLEYVLGDTLFLSAMKHYFNTWKFAHPYPSDFRKAIIDYTKTDLNWFFDQWMETTKRIDYALLPPKRVIKNETDGKFGYQVKLLRKGDMQMPLDLTVIDKNGKRYEYYIPNTYFIKPEGRTALRVWKGWGLLNTRYSDTIILDAPLRSMHIDTTQRLADVYRLDNHYKNRRNFLPLKVTLDKGISPAPGFNHRTMTWRPDIWFNAVDGLKTGLTAHFEYARVRHVLDVSIWYNSGLGAEKSYNSQTRMPVSYMLRYADLVGKDAYIFWDTRWNDGIFYDDLGFMKSFGKNTFIVHFRSISMDSNQSVYWPYAASAEREGKSNRSIIVDYVRNYKYKRGNGSIFSSLRGSSLTKDYGYGSFNLTVTNSNRLGKLELRTRFYTAHVIGNAIPGESMINLASANMEDMLQSKFTRSRGWIPQEWLGYGTGTNHFHMGGGLNLRGYAGYLAPVNSNQTQIFQYSGNGGISISGELDLDGLVKFKPRITRNWLKADVYLFGDAGYIYSDYNNELISSPLRADAGVGACLNLVRWGKHNNIQPFTIRFDMPWILNTPPAGDAAYIQNRWVVGIGRSF